MIKKCEARSFKFDCYKSKALSVSAIVKTVNLKRIWRQILQFLYIISYIGLLTKFSQSKYLLVGKSNLRQTVLRIPIADLWWTAWAIYLFTYASWNELKNLIQYDNREGEIKNCNPLIPVQRGDAENGLQEKWHKSINTNYNTILFPIQLWI